MTDTGPERGFHRRGRESVRESELIRDDPGRLLRFFIRTARDPEILPAVRLDAYRLLVSVLEGRLSDHELARRLHREWLAIYLAGGSGLRFGSHPPARRSL